MDGKNGWGCVGNSGQARHCDRRLDDGLFAGLQLRDLDFEVDVYERADGELAGRGAGIVAQPPVIEALRSLGLDPVDLGVQMTTRKILDVEGRTGREFRCPQTLTAGSAYRLLRDAFPPAHYRRGMGSSISSRIVARSRRISPTAAAFGPTFCRRRRHPLDRAPAASARSRPALCRLCRLAFDDP